MRPEWRHLNWKRLRPAIWLPETLGRWTGASGVRRKRLGPVGGSSALPGTRCVGAAIEMGAAEGNPGGAPTRAT